MNSVRFVALAAVSALTLGSAQAAYIVDTGEGSQPPAYSLYDDDAGGFQSLGATFNAAAAYTISSVEGWISALNNGNLTVELIAGDSPSGSVLFSATFAATPSSLGESFWQGATGLNWSIAAGDYTLAFYAPAGFTGSMLSGAPNPLATEWFRNDSTGGAWTQFDGLDVGIRIDASPSSVPEPGTLALLGLGLAGLGALRRRKL